MCINLLALIKTHKAHFPLFDTYVVKMQKRKENICIQYTNKFFIFKVQYFSSNLCCLDFYGVSYIHLSFYYNFRTLRLFCFSLFQHFLNFFNNSCFNFYWSTVDLQCCIKFPQCNKEYLFIHIYIAGSQCEESRP